MMGAARGETHAFINQSLTNLPPLVVRHCKGMAHITGGGLPENLPRIIPSHLAADVNLAAIAPLPPVFAWLARESQLPKEEMTKTFNCGVGMVIVVAADRKDEALSLLAAQGESPMVLGAVVAKAAAEDPSVVLNGELQ